jgi:hypothetical protein
MPLSEYFIATCSRRSTSTPSTAGAKFGELAKPLLERIPGGIYRELLADEIAKVVRLDPQRLAAALNTGSPQAVAPPSANPPRCRRGSPRPGGAGTWFARRFNS